MLYILMGPDDFSLRESLEELKKGMGDQALLPVNTTILEGQEITLNQLRTVCETAPFLAERRLVIVKGLMARFEAKGKSSRQKKLTRTAGQEDEYKALVAYISQLPDSIALVLMEGEIGNGNLLLREPSGKVEVRRFPLLKRNNLQQWIQRRVKKEGSNISLQAIDLLARLVGSNLWVMANEINKLVLFASGHRIEEADVRAVVSYTQEANVFAMVDAILEFKPGVAERLLQQLFREGAAPAFLLVMLTRQVRMIVRVKELRKQRQPEIEIQNRLGLTSEFTLRKVSEQADRHPFARVKEVYHKLLETDLSIKTGKYDGELALNILIVELCHRPGYSR